MSAEEKRAKKRDSAGARLRRPGLEESSRPESKKGQTKNYEQPIEEEVEEIPPEPPIIPGVTTRRQREQLEEMAVRVEESPPYVPGRMMSSIEELAKLVGTVDHTLLDPPGLTTIAESSMVPSTTTATE